MNPHDPNNASVRPRRKNGLEGPYTSAQLSTWVTLPTLVLQALFFVTPVLPIEASIPCTVVMLLLAIYSTYIGVKTSMIDPADPRLHAFCHDHQTGDIIEVEGAKKNYDENEQTKYCWICDLQVAQHSMHCKFCNKCVGHFDHHCMWLNTCVGSANYKFFFRTMVAITFFLVVHVALQAGTLIYILTSTAGEENARSWFGSSDDSNGKYYALIAVLALFVLVDLLALSLIGQLLAFHLKLQRQNLSTYQFIVQDNKRKRDEAKLRTQLQSKRIMLMAKAREEGEPMYAYKLLIGGFCTNRCGVTCCDPLYIEEVEKEKQRRKPAQDVEEASPNPTMSESPTTNGISANGGANGHHTNGIYGHENGGYTTHEVVEEEKQPES